MFRSYLSVLGAGVFLLLRGRASIARGWTFPLALALGSSTPTAFAMAAAAARWTFALAAPATTLSLSIVVVRPSLLLAVIASVIFAIRGALPPRCLRHGAFVREHLPFARRGLSFSRGLFLKFNLFLRFLLVDLVVAVDRTLEKHVPRVFGLVFDQLSDGLDGIIHIRFLAGENEHLGGLFGN